MTEPAATHHVVATAGHVDHGKSTLVRALTGTDPDRLDEERRRGLTIDLGFAWCRLPSGRDVAFVDVPGHVRFLKNMLAGVGGVDACVFVVAATEGWKQQSEEHLRILEVLGHKYGLVVLSMAGLVDGDDLELARLEVTDAVAGTFLDGAPILAVDAVDGRGLAELRLALDRMLGETPEAVDRDRPRLWVDRSFAPRGAGTVVTGTLTGGGLAVDDELVVEPGGRAVRVRGLQSEEQAADRLGPGRRVAVNLSGVSHHEVARGDALVRPGQWHRAQQVDARLDVLASLDHPVSRRGAYLAYLGSGEHAVSLRVLGPDRLEPGSSGFVRLHLPVPLPLLPGDRFVLREAGRQETVGGGELLDVDPRSPAARARPDADVDALVTRRGWIETGELERLTGERRSPTVGRWVVDPAAASARAEHVRAAVEAAGPTGLDVAALDERDRAVLDDLDDVQQVAGRATLGPADDPYAAHPYLAALTTEPFHPPTPTEAGISRADVRELVRRGHVVEHQGVCFSTDAVAEAARRLAPLLDAAPEGVTVGDVREALGASRKYVVPLLEVLDATGRTRRRGDRRIAGPRLLDP